MPPLSKAHGRTLPPFSIKCARVEVVLCLLCVMLRAWSQSRSGRWGFGTTFLGLLPVNGATLGQVYATNAAQSTGHAVEEQITESCFSLVSHKLSFPQ